jgi:hypothetical protein
MAMFHGIQDLEKGLADKNIIAHIPTPLGDIGEEVTLGTKVQHDVRAIWVVDNLQYRDNVRMRGSHVMQTYLPGLEFPLSLIQWFSIGIGFAQGFDGIPCSGEMIEC